MLHMNPNFVRTSSNCSTKYMSYTEVLEVAKKNMDDGYSPISSLKMAAGECGIFDINDFVIYGLDELKINETFNESMQ